VPFVSRGAWCAVPVAAAGEDAAADAAALRAWVARAALSDVQRAAGGTVSYAFGP
jgi:hypothetical protein